MTKPTKRQSSEKQKESRQENASTPVVRHLGRLDGSIVFPPDLIKAAKEGRVTVRVVNRPT